MKWKKLNINYAAFYLDRRWNKIKNAFNKQISLTTHILHDVKFTVSKYLVL